MNIQSLYVKLFCLSANAKVDFLHVCLDLSKLEVNVSSTRASKVAKTCPAAMEFAFMQGDDHVSTDSIPYAHHPSLAFFNIFQILCLLFFQHLCVRKILYGNWSAIC